jgi:hypothetical protein
MTLRVSLLLISVAIASWWSGGSITHAQSTADSGSKDPQLIASLIKQLADRDYRRREAASEQLQSIGDDALSYLKQAKNNPDIELRFRADRIVQSIEHDQFEARLKAFVDDVDGSRHATLPGWQQFEKRIGTGKHVREIYAEMFRVESQLLEAYARQDKKLVTLLIERFQDVYADSMQPSAGNKVPPNTATLFSILTIMSDDQVPVISDSVLVYFQNFLLQQHVVKSLSLGDDASGKITQKIFGQWVLKYAKSSNSYYVLNVAARYRIKEGLQVARELVGKSPQQVGSKMIYAMIAIGALGDQADIELLRPLLTMKKSYMSASINGLKIQVQLRDVALAMSIHLSGENLRDFGFVRARKDQNMLYVTYTLGFTDDQKRESAQGKWKAWQQTNRTAEN